MPNTYCGEQIAIVVFSKKLLNKTLELRQVQLMSTIQSDSEKMELFH